MVWVGFSYWLGGLG